MYYKEVNNMTTISLRLSDADNNLIKKYAELNGMSVSDLVRQYAGDGWTENSYEDQRKIPKTSSCTGDGIHELRTGWI